MRCFPPTALGAISSDAAVTRWVVAATVFLVLVALPSRGRAACVGDCGGEGAVSIDELVRGVNIALGNQAVSQCRAFDRDGSESVTIDELIAAVNNALTACPPEPTATIDRTPTSTRPAGPFCGDGVADADEECDGDDRQGCPGTCRADCTCKERPTVILIEPAHLAVINTSSVMVTGRVDNAVSVDVNGAPTILTGQNPVRFMGQVFLREGNNLIVATATNAAGLIGFASVTVTVDTQPPRMAIDTPAAGLATTSTSVDVAGMVNDIVVGTVNGEQATVTVNGRNAMVSNRRFLASDVPLAIGANVITAAGTDRAGNSASAAITLMRAAQMAQPRIEVVSGDGQSGASGIELAQPLVVVARDANGAAVVGETVIFKVVQNNGHLSGAVALPDDVRSIAVTTDAAGRAAARWTLGTRAGAAADRVEVNAAGFAGTVFTASVSAGAADKINVDAGDNQTSIVENPLPQPLVVVVSDAGHNRIAGVPVTFTVVAGGGNIAGQPSASASTDSDGRAFAVLTVGRDEGVANNVVEATFPGNRGMPARFVASAMDNGDPAETAISGVVLDNTDRPIAGATVRIDFPARSTRTNAQGQFSLAPVPVGFVQIIVDGSTVERPGTWPTLFYDLVTVAGRDNTIGMPVYLLPLDMPNALAVDEDTGGTLTLPHIPGFALTVAPGSATFPNGSGRSGVVSVTVVHADKIPMTPGFGQQPRLIVTIQPTGVLFDPPAAITLANVEGLRPGEVTDLYSFDHDLGQFVSIGTGTVSEDGAIVRSDPGVGIIKGGWHCGGNPMTTGAVESCTVRIIQKCTPDCVTLGAAPPVLPFADTGQLVAMGVPDGGEYSWSVGGSVFAIEGPTTEERVSLHGNALGSALVTVRYTCDSGAMDEDRRLTFSSKVALTTDLNDDAVIDAQDEALEGTVLPRAVHVEDPLITSGLVEVKLDVPNGPELAGYRLVLGPATPDVRVWDSPMKAMEIVLPRTYVLGTDPVPASVYIEGINPGLVTLRLTLLTPEGAECLRDDVTLSVIEIEFVDDDDEVQDLATDASQPYPEVELEALGKDDLTIAGNIATLRVSGSVTDAVAGIVAENRADITQVFVEFFDVPSDDPGAIDRAFLVSIPIAVTRDPSEPRTPERPFAFRGRFGPTEVQIPLWSGGRTVTVRAENAIGNPGYDSFSIMVSDLNVDVVRRGVCGAATNALLNGSACDAAGGDACAGDPTAQCQGLCLGTTNAALEGSACNPAGGDACDANQAATCKGRCTNATDTALEDSECDAGGGDACDADPTAVCQGPSSCRHAVDNSLEASDCNLAGGDACAANATAECFARGEIASIDVTVTPDQIADVSNHAATGPDLVNPIRVHITDMAVQESQLAQLRAQFFDEEFRLKIEAGQLQLERPFMALVREFPAPIPNLLDAINHVGPTTVRYRGVERDFYWGFTRELPVIVSPVVAGAAAGPDEEEEQANYFKYAAGTTVDHIVFNDIFGPLLLKDPSDVLPPAGTTVTEIEPVNAGGKPGYRIRMALANSIGRQEISFRLRDRVLENVAGTVSLARFQAVRLKTIIFGVDGFAHQAAMDVLAAAAPQGTAFKKIFRDAVQRETRALSALPSITWANWPGIFSGQSPGEHGIMGNSFFERERRDSFGSHKDPYFCSGDNRILGFPPLQPLGQLEVVTGGRLLGLLPGGLDDRARTDAGSLYEKVARVSGRMLNAISVHLFYHRGGGLVNFIGGADDLTPSPSYLPHDAPTAQLLDMVSGEHATSAFDSHRDEVNILSVYLPGPDNVAHAVGDKDAEQGFTTGPAVGEVHRPLHAIHEHFLRHTDGDVGKIHQVIEERGYRNATLFAVAADHGLHAYRNVDAFNITPTGKFLMLMPGEFQKLFETGLDLEMWRNHYLEDIDDQDLVYAANGGLAQIHIRSEEDRWNLAPPNARTLQVARALYIEAVGTSSVDPVTGEQATYEDCSDDPEQVRTVACYARLYPKLGPTAAAPNGALGFPPAIFARVGSAGVPGCGAPTRQSFDQEFRWVRFVRDDGTVVCDTIDAFVAARKASPRDTGQCCSNDSATDCRDVTQPCNGNADCAGFAQHQTCVRFEWPALRERIEESNDRGRPGASRSGEILIFTDGRAGYLTVNRGDEFNGWHGGATVSESVTPLLFNIPGTAVVEEFKNTLLDDAVNDAIDQRAGTRPSRTLRNWDLSLVLELIYGRLEAR